MGTLSRSYQGVYRSWVDSKRINRLTEGEEALYLRLLTVSDDFGRYHGDPFEVCAKVLTRRWKAGQVDPQSVEERLRHLEEANLIRRYDVDEETFLELVDYADPTPASRRRSEHPAPPQEGAVEADLEPCPQVGDACPQSVPNLGTACPNVGGLNPNPNPNPNPSAMRAREGDPTEAPAIGRMVQENPVVSESPPPAPLPAPTGIEQRDWESWLRAGVDHVQGTCPRMAKIAFGDLREGVATAVRQLVPPRPDPAVSPSAARRWEFVDPVPDLLAWLSDLERRAVASRPHKGPGWIRAALRSGPTPEAIHA